MQTYYYPLIRLISTKGDGKVIEASEIIGR